MPKCPKCRTCTYVVKNGVRWRIDRNVQVFRCEACAYVFNDPSQRSTETKIEPKLVVHVSCGPEVRRLPDEMAATIFEMYEIAGRPSGQTVPTFCLQILEATIADFRLRKVSAKLSPCERNAPSENRFRPNMHRKITPSLRRAIRTIKGDNDYHRRKLDADRIAQLLALAGNPDVAGVNVVRTLARRFGLGHTTVRRILREGANAG